MTEETISHYGTPRRSGRYPWGSGEDPYQSNSSFLGMVDGMKKQGMTEAEIARGLGMSTTQLRAQKSIAKAANREADISMALRLKDKGYSNVAIGARMGINESSVRALLDPSTKAKNQVLFETSNLLKEEMKSKRFLDIGEGTENSMGISETKLKAAVAILEAEGYEVHRVKALQLGTGHETNMKVLVPPGTTYKELVNNRDDIRTVAAWSEDGGSTFQKILPPVSIDGKRVGVRYAEDGGTEMDGVIQVRRGVDDISLGKANYAQVRIAVDGKSYLKGMAMYADDLPDGVDLMFNTNKKSTGNKHDAMKPLESDPDYPFGSVIRRQMHYTDASGKSKQSVMNILQEEGDWGEWSRSLASQMLSKQPLVLAKGQLDAKLKSKQAELDEIMKLTNPEVKRKLLLDFADGADSASVDLKAAALPRQATHVILPVKGMKETEIYAPNYRNGERVVLVRYPHGGTFEIPELTVNNKMPLAQRILGRARDAVGINSKVAERLSGADFDGDTVLVIPNNDGKIKTTPALAGLKDFDPKAAYPEYEGMPRMTDKAKQQQMGNVSNLITDMTIKGANPDEIARAVRHSMVVIDAAKHHLNYKQSADDNGINALKKQYQGVGPTGRARGASTVVSQAGADTRIDEVKPRSARRGGPIDIETGKLVYEATGATYVNAKGQTVKKTTKMPRMLTVDDAHQLSAGTRMEEVYANHANSLKAMANRARKEAVSTKSTPYSSSARVAYASEVASLDAKLNRALKNKPLERQAQIIAGAQVSAKKKANPHLEKDQIQKISRQALAEARDRTGATKQRITFTDREWEAVQAGAITTNKLKRILTMADTDAVKERALPRTQTGLAAGQLGRARTMMSAGYTQAEIADALGVSTTTLNAALKED